MAVSCLSPVRIQIFISAFIRVSMVSGTLSWSLSSIAVAPSSCRFYSRIFFFKKAVRGNHRKKNVFTTSCVRETCEPGVCHSFSHVSLHQLLFITHKTPNRLSGKRSVCLCVSVCASPDATSPIRAKAIQYSVFWVFFLPLQEFWWFFGASCRLIWGQNRVKYLTRPRGRGETWASSRGKAKGGFWNGDFSSSGPRLFICRSVLGETTQHAKLRLRGGQHH